MHKEKFSERSQWDKCKKEYREKVTKENKRERVTIIYNVTKIKANEIKA